MEGLRIPKAKEHGQGGLRASHGAALTEIGIELNLEASIGTRTFVGRIQAGR